MATQRAQKLLVFPYDWNPYQALLYGPMVAAGNTRIRYVRRYPLIGALLFPAQVLWWRLMGYSVIHIHWPAFTVDAPRRLKLPLSSALFELSLRVLTVLRIRIVWTVHNVMPHQPETTDDAQVVRRLAGVANAIIALTTTTIGELQSVGAAVDRVSVVPHGNYDGVYPDSWDRASARKELELAEDEFVVLFFGNVRPYKGVASLIQAAGRVDAKLRVLIVGGGADDVVRAAIAGASVPLLHVDRRVDDDLVALYHKACDVVAIPFTRVTNSGSAVLALTLGRPIVVPKLGALRDLPSDVGWFYEPDDPDGLRDALQQAADDRSELQARAIRARAHADSLDWNTIAERTRAVLFAR